MSKYPEHAMLQAVRHQSQKCGEFIEWLAEEKGIHLCTFDPNAWAGDGEYNKTPIVMEKILAEFFEIDLEKLEEEKRAMIEELRGEAS